VSSVELEELASVPSSEDPGGPPVQAAAAPASRVEDRAIEGAARVIGPHVAATAGTVSRPVLARARRAGASTGAA
jgi:hypothetical protein